MTGKIRLAHGHGGRLSLELIEEVILPALGTAGSPTMDAARIPHSGGKLVISTDSFTVFPIFFPGGDIGKLAACGTLNDVSMLGAKPIALALGLIIEEGFPIGDLARVVSSLGRAAREVGAGVLTGDTKVVEKGKCDGIFINTTGIGVERSPAPVDPGHVREDDAILLSGTIGDHGLAILNARHGLLPDGAIESDCAVLWPLVEGLIEACGAALHAMRDPTRGGLAATLGEFAHDTGREIFLDEKEVPIAPRVAQVLEVLGMDPLILANEGKLVAFVSPEAAPRALAAMRSSPLGARAAIIGSVGGALREGRVVLRTRYGTRRVVEMPSEEGLPRIC